jgi:predicted secreted protein
LAKPEVKEQIHHLAERIGSPEALRCCDNAATWDWREFLNERKKLI